MSRKTVAIKKRYLQAKGNTEVGYGRDRNVEEKRSPEHALHVITPGSATDAKVAVWKRAIDSIGKRGRR